ncbi:hypothetical protein PS685_05275 [Pseudomonas fluorescens]|uniref:Uncharacterized protein n=1 Tax=Pseudomonas fluorescens TaxID=294 RepID=A0A5E7AB33_PSEFL|nr:hypothetical protein PS685_05275 [Pseudomonas fluorescens]
MQARRDGKALLGQFDRRLEQLVPWQAAVFLMSQFQCAQHPWRAHRTTTDLCLSERHRLAVGLQEKLLGGAGRCGFAAVVSAHGLAIPKHDQRTTADARGLRLYQRQHGLHRNGRIDRRTTPAQHLPPGFCRQGIGRCRHVFRGVPGLQVGAVARGGFRCDRQRRGGRSIARGKDRSGGNQRQR